MRNLILEVRHPGRVDLLLLKALNEASDGAPAREPAERWSRARLKPLFQAKAILLDGRPVSASELCSVGTHRVSILAPPDAGLRQARPSPRGSFLPVVYQDADLLVLDKSSGVPSVPLSGDETHTAVSSALAADPRLQGVGARGLEPGLLHRLDTGTSGLLAFARTPSAYEHFRHAWKTGRVRKIYRAIVPALAQPLPWSARLELAHDARSSKRMIVVGRQTRPSAMRGKTLPTLTHLVRAHSLKQDSISQALTDLEIEIETGVMHQIRCTLAHLNSPVCGDPIYGGRAAPRLWLHAWKLHLPLMQGGELWLESPLPADWPNAQS